MTATPDTATARPRFADMLAVYLKPRVLIVLFLGFSAGLPLALSSSTLLVWMREVGVDLGVIGLFALVGTPYTLKFLWAPVVDALDIPWLSDWLGRRRGWLICSQFLLIVSIVLLALGGIATALLAAEPAQSLAAKAEHAFHAGENPLMRVAVAAYRAFAEFLG